MTEAATLPPTANPSGTAMPLFSGTKELRAIPMLRGDYNAYRGWTPPAGEDQSVDGYLVEYVDGGEPNDDRHTGYISWSPKDVFERAYKPSETHIDRMKIEHAQLDKRIYDLGTFINSSPVFLALSRAERELMSRQRQIMADYRCILGDRIVLATGEGQPA